MTKKMQKRVRLLPLVALGLFIATGAGVFAQRSYVAAHTNAGQPEVRVALAGAVVRGSERVTLAQAGNVHPGEVLDWTITSANEGTGAARDFKTVGQIPAGTVFVAGSTSADGAATVTYSIDRGQTFSAQPQIAEQQADGTVKRVPAPVALYTQVRYEWTDALAAGGKLTASYQVRVK